MVRSIRLALVAGLAFCASGALAQWWDPMPGGRPPPIGRPMFQTPPEELVYSPLVYDRAGLVAVESVMNGDFGKPDRMHDEFLKEGRRATHGLFLLESVQMAWDRQFRVVDAATLRQAVLQPWEKANPGSRLRKLVEAIAWQRQAWNARGGGYAGRVPGESMAIFRERLGRARKALEAAEPEGRESPLWYWVALIVAGSSGQPEQALSALYEDAAARFPYYHTIHATRMNYLLPQWGGDFDRVDAFVRQVVERTRQKDGEAFYAWLYMDVARKIDGDYLSVTRATWPLMKKGFEDMLARYPDAHNRNLFATHACRARDKATTAKLLAELGPAASLGLDSPGITTESCRRFALEGA